MPVQRGRRVTRLHIVEHTSERWRGSSGGSFALDSVLLSSPFLSSGTLGPEMSDVQLSGSALEHAAARRTYPLHGHTGACRSLFGPVDHDELAREMKAKLREISEHDRLRWNFDFAADAPLPGQFAWEEARVDAVPEFYRDTVPRGGPRCSRDCGGPDSEELNQENRSERLNSGRPQRPVPACIPRKGARAVDPRPARITDYFGKKKKNSERKRSASPPATAPLEQTPRKRIR